MAAAIAAAAPAAISMGAGQAMGGVGKAAGGLADIYGTYKGIQMAEKQFAEDKRRYEDQLVRMRQMDALAMSQMDLGNIATKQGMAQTQASGLQNTYGTYNRMIGR